MARRTVPDEPTSKLAIWGRRLALFSLATAAFSIVIVRSGLLELHPALATFGAALAIAAVSLPLAFAAFVAIWRDGLKGMAAALSAIAISGALLAYPAYLSIHAYGLPWIYDITTDAIDPPRYDTLARVRPRDANPAIYAGLTAAEQQFEAYPDIEPVETAINAARAYEAALSLVARRRWRVVEARPPNQRQHEGRIEAVARTPIMGFRDDVVIRVRPEAEGARIDIRSSSRYDTFDFGTNAARIRALITDIETALAALRPEEEPLSVPASKKKAQSQSKGGQPSAKR